MPSPTIRVTGADELRRAFRAAGQKVPKEVGEANKAAAEVVVKKALPNVPVRTGRLKRSVRALGSQRAGRVRAGSARVDYAATIHWGRKRGNVWGGRMGRNVIIGRPFLFNAARDSRRKVVETYEQAVRALVERITR